MLSVNFYGGADGYRLALGGLPFGVARSSGTRRRPCASAHPCGALDCAGVRSQEPNHPQSAYSGTGVRRKGGCPAAGSSAGGLVRRGFNHSTMPSCASLSRCCSGSAAWTYQVHDIGTGILMLGKRPTDILLELLKRMHAAYKQGEDLRSAFKAAAKSLAKKEDVSEATIRDTPTRGLGLSTSEFCEMALKHFKHGGLDLVTLIQRRAQPLLGGKILDELAPLTPSGEAQEQWAAEDAAKTTEYAACFTLYESAMIGVFCVKLDLAPEEFLRRVVLRFIKEKFASVQPGAPKWSLENVSLDDEEPDTQEN